MKKYLQQLVKLCLLFAMSGFVLGFGTRSARAVEHVTYQVEGKTFSQVGKIKVAAKDGGLLLQTPDSQLWVIEAKSIVKRSTDEEAFQWHDFEQQQQQLQTEFPGEFRYYKTKHYLVCYNTSREYAKWVSSLLERLHKAFTGYWKKQGLTISEPEFPLVVMVFNSKQSYLKYAAKELGKGAGNVVGYYSLQTNRIAMYDLTGVQSLRTKLSKRGSLKEISQMLLQPAAVPLVATIVHEATHQIAFNSGLQQRYADIPLWLAEGMAVYFEAPDMRSRRGWKGIGRVNYARLKTHRRNLSSWNRGSLVGLLADNKRFKNPRTVIAAYADAWALNYYLIKFRTKEYVEYLKVQAEKGPLLAETVESRLKDFREAFGDLKTLEKDFLKRMRKVK